MIRVLVSLALIAIALTSGAAARQAAPPPESLIVTSGPLQLRALLFRPRGNGPFPAVLFNHGSYVSTSPMPPDTAAIVGDVFAKHGYALLFLYRQGIGLSIGQGAADGDLMENAFKTSGADARNRVQIYPPFGANASDGHNIVFLSVPMWEQDVFAFLDPLMRR